MSRASSTYGSAADERSGQRRGRRAARRPISSSISTAITARATISRPAASCSRPALRAAGRGQPRSRRSAALAALRGRTAQQRRPDLGHRRRRRLDRRRQQCRLLGQPLRQPLRHPDPLLARSGGRGGGAADRPQADPRRRPRRDRHRQRLHRHRSGCAAAIPTIAISRSRTPATVGTTFFNKGCGGPARSASSRRGTAGAAASARNISSATSRSIGEEKFLPPNRTQPDRPVRAADARSRHVQGRGGPALRASARFAPTPMPIIGNPALRRSFDAFSGSVGASYALRPRLAHRPQRVAQRARAIGRGIVRQRPASPAPRRSRSAIPTSPPRRAGASKRRCAAPATASASAPPSSTSGSTAISYERRPALVAGRSAGLPISPGRRPLFRLRDRRLGRASPRSAAFAINVDGVADYVRATIDGAGPAPRIPPLRLLGGIEAQSEPRQRPDRGRMGERAGPHRRVRDADRRLYDGQRLALHPPVRRAATAAAIVLSANNIFDVDARRHASFLKDYAPLAGRDLQDQRALHLLIRTACRPPWLIRYGFGPPHRATRLVFQDAAIKLTETPASVMAEILGVEGVREGTMTGGANGRARDARCLGLAALVLAGCIPQAQSAQIPTARRRSPPTAPPSASSKRGSASSAAPSTARSASPSARSTAAGRRAGTASAISRSRASANSGWR